MLKDDKVTVLQLNAETSLFTVAKLGLRGDQFYYKIERIRESNGVVYIYPYILHPRTIYQRKLSKPWIL